jgi:hypothetical protein
MATGDRLKIWGRAEKNLSLPPIRMYMGRGDISCSYLNVHIFRIYFTLYCPLIFIILGSYYTDNNTLNKEATYLRSLRLNSVLLARGRSRLRWVHLIIIRKVAEGHYLMFQLCYSEVLVSL